MSEQTQDQTTVLQDIVLHHRIKKGTQVLGLDLSLTPVCCPPGGILPGAQDQRLLEIDLDEPGLVTQRSAE